jgi:hemerythrin-like domain-containing protein
MKTATQNLKNDHDHILQLIDIMYIMADRKSQDIADIETVISLIRNFADGFHHAKEENLLFPTLIEKGFSKEQGPIAVMFLDHVQGRRFVQEMDRGLQFFKRGDNTALEMVYENMLAYGELLESHISKENNILFRMADKALSDAEQEQLLFEFEKIEKNIDSNITEYIEAINNLKMLYIRETTI